MDAPTITVVKDGGFFGHPQSDMGNVGSMRFHPIGGGPEDDKDGQEAWFTAGIASLIGEAGD